MFPDNSSLLKHFLVFLITFLALALGACQGTVPGEPPVAEATEAAVPALPTEASTATRALATVTAVPPTATPTASVEGETTGAPGGQDSLHSYGDEIVTFDYALSLFSQVQAEVVPASDLPEGFFGIPAHQAYTLEDYGVSGSYHEASISVFPAMAYASMNRVAAARVDLLEGLLDAPPAALESVETLPFLPTWNAAQVFRAQAKRLSFQDGNGIRYLALYAQDTIPVVNHFLFYTYQGLTADGAYYVSAILPVRSDMLEDDLQGSEFTCCGPEEEYEAYLAEMRQMLNGLEADAFEPSLAELDTLLQSLQIVADAADARATMEALGPQTFSDQQYGFSFTHPSNFAVIRRDQTAERMPPEYPIKRDYGLKQLDVAKNATSVSAPFSVAVIEGDLDSVDFLGEVKSSETATFNGYEALVQERSDGHIVDYVFQHPADRQRWIVFRDGVSAFPQREAQARSVEGVLAEILSTLTFEDVSNS